MKVHLVTPAKAGIQTAFYGFPLKAWGNDGLVTKLTFMFRCEHQVMTGRRRAVMSNQAAASQQPPPLTLYQLHMKSRVFPRRRKGAEIDFISSSLRSLRLCAE